MITNESSKLYRQITVYSETDMDDDMLVDYIHCALAGSVTVYDISVSDV